MAPFLAYSIHELWCSSGPRSSPGLSLPNESRINYVHSPSSREGAIKETRLPMLGLLGNWASGVTISRKLNIYDYSSSKALHMGTLVGRRAGIGKTSCHLRDFSETELPLLRASRKLARAIGNDEAPGLFTEGFYRYSVLSASPNATNHHLNLLAQQFIFRLRDLA